MALKKPGELFGEKIKVETPVKVEEPQKQTDNVFSSFASSLSEVIEELSAKVDTLESMAHPKPTGKTQKMNEDRLDALEKTNQSLRGEIGIVEHRQQTNNFDKIKNEVVSEIKKLEDKIEIIKEAYEENILKEGLLNEPPSTDNEDPLTALDQKFVTLDKFEEHYKLFVNRIQKQLSTLGGGGAVNIKDMDDVDLSTAQVNNKYLKYDSSSSKWVGDDASGGSGITTEFVSSQTLNVVGISTFNDDVQFKGQNTNAKWNESSSDLTLYNATRLVFGDNEDFQIWHGGTHTFMRNSETGGDLRIRGDKILLKRSDDAGKYIECTKNQDVKLFYNENEKFATLGTGVTVTGVCYATSFSGDGSALTGVSAAKGEKGAVGPGGGDKGQKGEAGVKGQKGEVGSTGSSGSNGSAGSKGQKGEVGTGSAGDKGQKGAAGGGGGSGLDTRGTTSAATGSIAQTASANITISTRGKSFSLLKVAISAPAWVVLYVDSASRSSDSSRTEGTDPAPGAGVLTEVSTTTAGASTFLMSPAVLGWNNDSTPAAQVYAKVTNKRSSSGSNAITVTLTTVSLEA